MKGGIIGLILLVFVDTNKGSILWDIHASPAPKAPFKKIGQIKLTSQIEKSVYGDETLFFKHQLFEEDLKIRPEWLKACPTVDSCPVCPVDVDCQFAAETIVSM